MRILAIGDIHGCSTALDTLLDYVSLHSHDIVVTLGDYVNKGPDSKGVLDRLLALHERGQLVPIRGNHDLMFLWARSQPEEKAAQDLLSPETLESYGSQKTGEPAKITDVPDRHWRFLAQNCLNYWETQDHIFLHATADPHLSLDRQPHENLFWQKFSSPLPHQSGKVMICGHTSQKSGQPVNLGHAICIDTWACGEGWLTALDVNTGQVWQANQQGQTQTAHIRDFQEQAVVISYQVRLNSYNYQSL